jgi:DNA-binding transcriptional LysR family regulator
VALEEDTADRLLPQLLNCRIDLAVVRMWHPLVHQDLLHKVLMDEPIVIVVGPQHPLASQPAVSWQDAIAHPWIVPKAGSPAHGALEALFASHGHRIPDGSVESISFALNLALYACSPFIGLLPERTAKAWEKEGRIAVLPLDTDRLLSEVRVFWRTGDREPALTLMLECLESAADTP